MSCEDDHIKENGHSQSNEILALKSIFEANVFTVNEVEKNGRFLVHPILPKAPYEVAYDGDDQEDKCTICVQHLPPIELNFELSANYPSGEAPNYWISCIWLSFEDLTKVCSQLDNLWQENKSEILFIWFEFLQNEILTYLNHSSTLKLNCLVSNKIDAFTESVFNLSINSGQSLYDKRIVPQVFGSDLKKNATTVTNYLKTYNEKKCREDFDSSYWTCIICFRNRLGSDCVYFPCYHTSCKECVSDYFKIQIQEGNVHMLKCPETKCKVEATPTTIKELVGENLYQRYDQLWFQLVLQSMGEIVYCPRRHCQSPVVSERDSKLAICSKCGLSFCTNCKFTYHGVSPCRMFHNKEERNEMLHKYRAANDEGKRALEKIYGKKQIEEALNAFLSEEYISDNTKKCPNCRANIEKSEGCNKMACWRCGAYFCWLCETVIPPDGNPYRHFSNPASKCYNKLFQGIDGRDLFEEILNERE